MQVIINLIYDSEYDGYVAQVPELPGCLSQGRTVEEALQNVREAIDLYLEDAPQRRKASAKPSLTAFLEI